MSKIIGVHVPDGIKNYLINGDMRIAQRGTSFTLNPGDTTFPVDRNQCAASGGAVAVATISQDTDVPSAAQAGYLFQNSLKYDVTTANASAQTGTNFVWGAQQRIEGSNWANLAQKPFTLSFWVKAVKTGIYCVAFRNGGLDRSYVAEYTINGSNTWEYKTITVAASPSAGTWNYSNGNGLFVTWVLAAGPGLQGVANTWQAGNVASTSNQVNGVDNVANNFWVTGIMLNEGPLALPFKLYSDNSIETELMACQRYHWQEIPSWIWLDGYSAAGGGYLVAMDFRHPVAMRATPTMTMPTFSTQTLLNTPTFAGTTANGFAITAVSTGVGRMILTSPSTALIASAEL